MTSEVIDAGDGLPLTVGSLLVARAAEHGEAPFLIVDDDRLTYAEAARRSERRARALLAGGLGRGSRVALLHPNGSDLVVDWLAAARIGAVSVPLSTFSTGPELVGLLAGADVSALSAAARYRSQDFGAILAAAIAELDVTAPGPLASSAVPSLRRITFTGEGSRGDTIGGDAVGGATPGGVTPGGDEVAGGAVGEDTVGGATPGGDAFSGSTVATGGPGRNRTIHPDWTEAGLDARADRVSPEALAAAEADVTPADPMVIVHTSGSTSAPKGVVHAHGALIRHLDNLNQLRSYTSDEILFANSPFFWIGGFAYSLLGTLVAGARLVASNAADASAQLDVLERERPTLVNGFAAGIAHLAEDPSFAGRDLSSIRRGNLHPIMPPEVRPADPELRHAMLGMTETGSVCLASDDETDQPEHRRGSFGRPVPGFEAEVRDEKGRRCEPGEVGVLWFRGPFLMEGYDGRERHHTFDPDGWYDTGDRVTVDDDGFIYFQGRRSDMIKTAGANVSPREVEAAILDATGLVAHVVGVDDPARGQLVAALVRSADPLDEDDLRTRLRERLSAYKVPKRFRFVPDADVPMMSSGKIDLRALEELFRD